MHTEDEYKEFLYPNITYCGYLKSGFKYVALIGAKLIEGFHARQKMIGEALKMNYEDKPHVAVHLRDIVVTMMVSYSNFCLLNEPGIKIGGNQ